jgi:TRAP-type uncharacterized transport system fused permease subunit
MRTGWESMWVGSIIYFIPFFFVLNPALVLQGSAIDAMLLAGKAAVGILFICGGIQGYQAGIGDLRTAGVLEWPLRIMLVIGGFVLATPGGGIMPLSEWAISSLGLALIAPAAAIAWLFVQRDARLAPRPAQAQ